MFSKYSAGLKNPGNNAQFEDELCYTEDNILVYNLYIRNIPEDVNEAEVKDDFSRYGEVLSVNIIKSRCGFVNFVSANSAAKALKFQEWLPSKYMNIIIKPADKWKQPAILDQDNQQLTEPPKKKLKEEDEIEENSILKLNDDCLIHIFSFLSLKEQITLSKICERFLSIFQIMFRKHKSITLTNTRSDLDLFEIKYLISHVHCYIENASLQNKFKHRREPHFSRFLKLILQSCENLRCIKISWDRNISSNIYRRNYLPNLKSLQTLLLSNCDINDRVCSYLSRLPMLETLDISGNSKVTGNFLSTLPKLRQLNLEGCRGIQPEFFSTLCKKRNLTSLNIRNCCNLKTRNFKEMVTTLENLTSLIISNNYKTSDLYHIANLKNLTELIIYGGRWNHLEDHLFELLATKRGNNLQTLILQDIYLNNNKKECINSLKGLRNLGLFQLQLDDDILQKLTNLPNLVNLSLAGCELPSKEQSLSSFFKGSNTLSYIDISLCTGFKLSDLYDILGNVEKLKRSTIPCTLYMSHGPSREHFGHEYMEFASYLLVPNKKSELTKKFCDTDALHLLMNSSEHFYDAPLRNFSSAGFMRRPNHNN